MTSEQWEILSNTNLSTFHVSLNQENIEINKEKFREILKSLNPIKKTIKFEGPFEGELLYQGGRDPTTILIHIKNDALIYKLGSFTYEGGSPIVLKQIMENI